jgi:hypothetical protein
MWLSADNRFAHAFYGESKYYFAQILAVYMKVQPIHGESGRESWNGGTTLMPSEPGGRFRVLWRHHRTGEVIGPARIATEIVAEKVPWAVASQLPYQPNTELLDQHLPPDPDDSNVRTNGHYRLTIYSEMGKLASGGSYTFEEFTPGPPQPALEQ